MPSIDKNKIPSNIIHEDFKLEFENNNHSNSHLSEPTLSSSQQTQSVPLSDSESLPSLDAYSYSRLKEVRRSIWNGGLTGLMYGLGTGALGSLIIIKYYPTANFYPFKSLKPKNGNIMNANQLRTFCIKRNNILLFTTLVFGAIFSFIGATVEGKNKVHFIQDIFSYNNNSSEDSKSKNNKNSVITNTKENWNDMFSSEKFYSRQRAIEAQKEKKKQDEEELRKRSY